MSEAKRKAVQSAIQSAFLELLREKSYDHVTVGEIAQRARVRRTTFYRHYETKADLLIKMHAHYYEALGITTLSREVWLSAAPAPYLPVLLQRLAGYMRLQPMWYALGKDIDTIMHGMDNLLSQQIENGLRAAFREDEFTMPINMLSQGIAGMLTWLLRMNMNRHGQFDSALIATQMQRMIRAVILDALRA
jgi:AcrR family transcriptional regulator